MTTVAGTIEHAAAPLDGVGSGALLTLGSLELLCRPGEGGSPMWVVEGCCLVITRP